GIIRSKVYRTWVLRQSIKLLRVSRNNVYLSASLSALATLTAACEEGERDEDERDEQPFHSCFPIASSTVAGSVCPCLLFQTAGKMECGCQGDNSHSMRRQRYRTSRCVNERHR